MVENAKKQKDETSTQLEQTKKELEAAKAARDAATKALDNYKTTYNNAKAKYDAALDEMEKLVTKRKQQDDKKVLDAYHAGNKTADEIVAFIQSEKPKSD